MQFNRPVTEIIKERISIRSYDKSRLKDEDKKKIISIINGDHGKIFDGGARFEFIDAWDIDPDELKNLGTYGFITGAKYFIAGIAEKEKGKYCLVDLGYAFEKIILILTDMGFGTCWLGGTFNKKGFSKNILLEDGEFISAVSPVGVIRRNLRSSVIRTFAGSKKRKSWEELFYNSSFLKILDESAAGHYREPLEMLRLGPSASNIQPWRVIKEENGDIFHFFIKNSNKYLKMPEHMNLQYLDMGIAFSHFELTASQMELRGKWTVMEGIQENKIYGIPTGIDYVVTWDGS